MTYIEGTFNYLTTAYPTLALFSDQDAQVHSFQSCRDFLQDYLHIQVNKDNPIAQRYSGLFRDQDKQPSLESANILVRMAVNLKFDLPAITEFVHKLEQYILIPKSKILLDKVQTPHGIENILIFRGSRRWLVSPTLFSLYTLCLRNCQAHTLGDNFLDTWRRLGKLQEPFIQTPKSYDDKYCAFAVPVINFIKHNGRRSLGFDIKSNYPADQYSKMHSNTGIASLGSMALLNEDERKATYAYEYYKPDIAKKYAEFTNAAKQ